MDAVGLGVVQGAAAGLGGVDAIQKAGAGSVWAEKGYVFTSETGEPLNPRTDYTRWKDLLAAAGIRDGRLHDARHTAATVLLLLKIPNRIVEEPSEVVEEDQADTDEKGSEAGLDLSRSLQPSASVANATETATGGLCGTIAQPGFEATADPFGAGLTGTW